MKLQVERDPLAEAVAWTARALPARPTAPVLAGMRLQAGSELTLSTFDYEVSAQSTIPVQADEPGTVLVSGKLLAEIVRSLPARPVDLTTDGTRTTVKCGSATFTLMLLPTEEYPTLPGMPEVTGHHRRGHLRLGDQPGRHRRGPGRHAARADRHPHGDQRGHADPGRHRPVPARRPRASLDPGRARPQHGRARPGPGARRHRPRADQRGRGRSGAGHRRGRHRRRHHRLRGQRPQDHHPAAVRRVPALPDAAAERVLRRSPSCPRRRSRTRSSASRWSPSGTPRSASRSPPARSCSRRAPATRPRRARRSRRPTTARRCRSRSTRSTCSTASARSTPTPSGSRSPRRPGPP